MFPSQERGKALGIIGSIALLGVSIGPTVEALVFGVQMSFRLVAPILMAATILAAFLWWLEQRKQLPPLEEAVSFCLKGAIA